VIQTLPRQAASAIEIPTELDPRLVDSAGRQRQRLGKLSPAQRAVLILDRYPELRGLPDCDWEQLSAKTSFSILFGETVAALRPSSTRGPGGHPGISRHPSPIRP